MTITDRHRAELLSAAKFAVRRFKSIRRAAVYLGMSRSGLHDFCKQHSIPCVGRPGPR